MNSDLKTLVRRSDPMQVLDVPPVTADADDALFQSISMRRGTTMTTDQRTPTEHRQPEPAGHRSRWLVAAAAFGVVVLVAVATFLFAGQRDDADPAAPTTTAPPTTTTVPPTTTTTLDAAPSTTVAAPVVPAAQAAAIASFEAAWNDGDEEALRAVFAPDAGLEYRDAAFPFAGVDQIVAWALARQAMEVVASIDDCVPTDGETVTCTAEFDGAVISALNFVPLRDTYTITFEDDVITHIGVDCQICANRDLEFEMGQWVRSQAPGAQAQCSPGCPTLVFVNTPEQAAYYLEWAVKWEEAGRP